MSLHKSIGQPCSWLSMLLLGYVGLSSPACGHSKKSTSSSVASNSNNTGSNSDPNVYIDPTGVEHAVSVSPHPSDCLSNNPPIPPVTSITNCDTVGALQTSEGLCFVQSTVQPTWNNEPPSSGPQYTFPDFNYYASPTPVPRGQWVRSLAHGYVVIAYNCPTDCSSDVASANQLITQTDPGNPVILTPDPLLQTGYNFAAIAWGYVYNFNSVDPNTLLCFIQQHAGNSLTEPDLE